ncbi:hypothetical protein KCU88_g122, partial [Aureobasidium melanogenum]
MTIQQKNLPMWLTGLQSHLPLMVCLVVSHRCLGSIFSSHGTSYANYNALIRPHVVGLAQKRLPTSTDIHSTIAWNLVRGSVALRSTCLPDSAIRSTSSSLSRNSRTYLLRKTRQLSGRDSYNECIMCHCRTGGQRWHHLTPLLARMRKHPQRQHLSPPSMT